MDVQSAAIIQQAINHIRASRRRIDLLEDYYRGRHRTMWNSADYRAVFARMAAEFRLNLCPVVVDTLADRLQITGWQTTDDKPADTATRLWRDGRLDIQSGGVHRDTMVRADGYLIVWQDDAGNPVIVPLDSREMWVGYSRTLPGVLDAAVRVWHDPTVKRIRLNLYLVDRVERYAATATDDGGVPEKASSFHELTQADVPSGADHASVVIHEWGVVPVFHLANNAPVGHMGRSELTDVIPIQDHLNKHLVDLAFASETEARPARFAVGVESPIDETGRPVPLRMGAGEVATFPNHEATIGQFPGMDLRPMREVATQYILDIARVTGVPLHLLMPTGDWPSGEALKTAESRQARKADDRCATWGPVWGDAMELACRMAGDDPGEIEPIWAPTGARVSERESWETAALQLAAGVPRTQVWRERGYTDEQITAMTAEAADEARMSAEVAARAFNAGAAG